MYTQEQRLLIRMTQVIIIVIIINSVFLGHVPDPVKTNDDARYLCVD